jgi:hypothetical protein
MSEERRHVLVWVVPEFLKSSGLIQLFTEAGIFEPAGEDLDEYIRSAEKAGGFALTGRLAETHHGAGIWISPAETPGLELMVPWQFVKSVVTAESAQPSRAFGLMRDLARANGNPKRNPDAGGNRDKAQ